MKDGDRNLRKKQSCCLWDLSLWLQCTRERFIDPFHPSTHRSIDPSIHPCIHASIHACMHASINPSIHPFTSIHPSNYPLSYGSCFVHLPLLCSPCVRCRRRTKGYTWCRCWCTWTALRSSLSGTSSGPEAEALPADKRSCSLFGSVPADTDENNCHCQRHTDCPLHHCTQTTNAVQW